MIFKKSKTVDDILKGSLRILNAYSDGEEPEVEDMENARDTLNDILDFLETKGFLFFLREWRIRVFEPSSVVKINNNCYRCILSHKSPNYTQWGASKSYQEGDLVIPAIYNGYYYELKTVDGGISGTEQPAFPENQDESVSDNGLTWVAIPDTKPSVGKNWHKFWYKNENLTEGSQYTQNTSYKRAGDFELNDDEQTIERVFCRKQNQDYKIDLLRDADFADLDTKYTESMPVDLYLEQKGTNNISCHLYPSPNETGKDGYVLHYLASLRIENYEGSKDISLPEDWFLAIKWLLCSELGQEFQIPLDQQIYNDRKADKLLSEAMKTNRPKIVTRSVIKSAY